MKMVKSLLLGSAAGVVAVAGAQAADLPVKAKPVQYVKICTLYGDGFYYIPGTDICIKFAGYIRSDYGYNVNGARTAQYSGTGGAQDRTVSPYSTRHRANLQIDSRIQTQFGTVRTFQQMQMQNENLSESFNVSRAFTQFAGFTFGRTKSFTDPLGQMGDGAGNAQSLHQTQNQSDTGANGVNQIAYTWELGNGATLSVGMDETRRKSLTNLSNANVVTAGAEPTTSFAGQKFPDPWIAFKIAQAWGEFDVAAIAHDVSALYYTSTAAGSCPTTVLTGTTQCTYPTDQLGWAVLSGINIKLPSISRGTNMGAYFNYSQGASAYGGGSNLASPNLFNGWNGGVPTANFANIAVGWITDGVYCNPGTTNCASNSIQLTTAWTAGGFFMYFWDPQWSTTVYGNYTDISYNSTVVNNRWFCSGGLASQSIVVAAGVACNPGFQFWTVGTHTDWFPVPGMRLAVDVLYTFINSAFDGNIITLNKTTGARPSGAYAAKSQGILSFVFRAQKTWGGE